MSIDPLMKISSTDDATPILEHLEGISYCDSDVDFQLTFSLEDDGDTFVWDIFLWSDGTSSWEMKDKHCIYPSEIAYIISMVSMKWAAYLKQ